MKKSFALLSVALAFACGKSDPQALEESVRFTSFKFTAADNPGFSSSGDVNCTISGDGITALIPYVKSGEGLVPSFGGDFARVEVGGTAQVSGNSPQDFRSTVTYRLVGERGSVRDYRVTVKVYTGLPIVEITTDGSAAVASKDDYVNGSVSVSKTPEFSSGYQGRMRIKGRGNATWNYEKKPYRIKFDSKSAILDMPADKDWVLLAEYCDKSLLRTSYLFELAKLFGLPWTPRSHHVELFMNGAYQGTYLMGEHVKVAADRADIASDGFLFERDNYWYNEPLWFTTNRGVSFTFKYPDPDGEIASGDEKYNFIKNFMNNFEAALYRTDYRDPGVGYRKYIDAENFARWYLVQEILGNIDTNPYYALESRTSKLKMYPVWDAEWSLGLAAAGNNGWAAPPTVSPVGALYWRHNTYFDRLLTDPYFAGIVKAQWALFKSDYNIRLRGRISAIEENLIHSQVKNFQRWPILGRYISVGLVKFDTWQQEVDYADNFLTQRIAAIDAQIAAFGQ